MSLPSSPSAAAPAAQKPGTNIYTVMLMLAFLFIVIATVMLSIELMRFGDYPWWQIK